MGNSTQIFLVMIAYASLLLMWGWWQGRKVKSSKDFAIAGRKLPGWVASLSERATGESSWALLGLPGAAYATGLLETWTAIGCVVGIILSWMFLAWRFQKEAAELDANTFTDFLAKKHGESARLIRVIGSLTIVFFFFFYIGAQFIGGAKTLNNLFGLNPVWGMILVTVLVIPYTIYGGFRSVAYTDVIQAIVMIVALIVTPIVGIIYLKHQPVDNVFATSIPEALRNAGPSFTDMKGGLKGFNAGCLIGGSLAWMFGYLGGLPQLTTRFMAIKDMEQAKKGRNIGIIWTIIAYAGALSIGWLGIAIFGPNAIADRENIMPTILTTVFHPIIAGIL
ncbi:MAG: sodium/proline symporter, partial [Bacteroidales bacterium]|nr:sodium/proline symporter [Bacteroidales bacterium]